jgi:hypothetical protein
MSRNKFMEMDRDKNQRHEPPGGGRRGFRIAKSSGALGISCRNRPMAGKDLSRSTALEKADLWLD